MSDKAVDVGAGADDNPHCTGAAPLQSGMSLAPSTTMISRRRALAAVASLGSAPLANAWQVALARKRVGVLRLGAAGTDIPALTPTLRALAQRGWTIGGNLVLEPAYADWHFELLDALAATLVQKNVHAIVCYGDDALAVAAAHATKNIPILFNQAFAPVEQGFVDSLANPGRNMTGTSVFAGFEFIVKRLEFLRAIAPSATRLSWLYGGQSLALATLKPEPFDAGKLIERVAQSLGFTARVHLVRSPAEVPDALRAAEAWGAEAISAGGTEVFAERAQIATFARTTRVPTVYSLREYVDAGGLLSYGVPPSEYDALDVRWAAQIDQVLRGSNPANMPVELPSRYELCINAGTARALGLAIPRSLLTRADVLVQ